MQGLLTRDGRLTRGGAWFLRGLCALLWLGVVLERQALSSVLFGERAAGRVVAYLPIEGRQRDYKVRVEYAPAGAPIIVERPLSRGSGGARLAVGDAVEVAYRPDAPDKAVLVFGHENWAGAPWTAVLGAVFLLLSWVWRPLPGAGS